MKRTGNGVGLPQTFPDVLLGQRQEVVGPIEGPRTSPGDVIGDCLEGPGLEGVSGAIRRDWKQNS